ncbi:MAG: cadherin repeat domain-containing protein, partial [Gammaproteobacteria bacterium]
AVGDGTIWISHNFTLSILDINDPEQNDQPTEWSGTQDSLVTMKEDIDVVEIAEIADPASYTAITTFTPLDEDEDANGNSNFGYYIASDYAWMFEINPDGVLKLKYNLDYENTFYPPNISMTIWAWGTDGGDPIGKGGAISQNFVLSIAEVNQPINDQATEWDGAQPDLIAVSETAGVDNLRFDLTTSEYVAVATFTPKDADGDEFGYGISGDYAWMFDIGSDGVLKLKYQLDYESAWFPTTNFSATVWTGGLSGGTAYGNAIPWISQNFVLSVVDVFEDTSGNNQPTMWSGTQPIAAAVSETLGIADNSEVADGGNYINLATFTPSDVDGGVFEFHVGGHDANFFAIGTDGILQLKYNLDAESQSHPADNYSITIWARGTSGGSAPFGDALTTGNNGFITQAFVLSVDSFNDELTEWSGNQLSMAAVDEVAGVSNLATLTTANYQS